MNRSSSIPSLFKRFFVNSSILTGNPLRHEASHASANMETRRQSDGATNGTIP